MNLLEPETSAIVGTPFASRYFAVGVISRRAELAEYERDLVAVDELADVLHRLRRTVGIVHRDVVDLAAIDAAAVVDQLNVGKNALADEPDR